MTCRIAESPTNATTTLILSGLSRQTGEAIIRMLGWHHRGEHHRVTLHERTATVSVKGRSEQVHALLRAAGRNPVLSSVIVEFVQAEDKATREALQ